VAASKKNRRALVRIKVMLWFAHRRSMTMPQDADKTGLEILPIPDQPYRGPVPFDTTDAYAPQQPILRAPNRAPSVLIDDMDFGIPSAFGSCVDMPTTDRSAKAGLRHRRTEQFLERT
jgi:hypothetical protein